jgi:hypothetical protein
VSLAEELDRCLAEAEGCHCAALVDLDAGLLLAIRGADDAAGAALAAATVELLGRARAPLIAEGEGGAAQEFSHAVVAGEGALHVFHRLAAAPGRVLCLGFGAEAPAEAALAWARRRETAVGAAGLW